MSDLFQHSRRVTYADCTLGNHVYYSRYLDFLEEARGEFLRHLGASFLRWQEQDVIFPVLEVHLRYRAAARYDDVIGVAVSVARLDRIRVAFAYRVTRADGHLLLEGETQHVCTSLAEKPRRIPEEMAALLSPHVSPEAV
jgi:acyl-CoA thioester hydrolase